MAVRIPIRSGTHGRHNVRGAFTLIELLVVMGIVAIIMLIALPRFTDIGRGSKMKAAVSELRSTLGLARQWAIANRDTVFIVFPDDYATLFGGVATNHYPKALRSYAVYSARNGFIKDYQYLPQGIFFVDQNNSQNLKTDGRLKAANNVFRPATYRRLPFPENTSPLKIINSIQFQPDGTVATGVVPYEIFISEGVVLEGSAGKVINILWKANPVLWSLEVNPYTGMARLSDYSAE